MGKMNPENLYKLASNLAQQYGWISVSLFQRQYALGFSVARTAILRLEAEGIVSQPDKQGARALLNS